MILCQAARAKASKSAAAPVQRILNRAARGEPVKRKQKVANKAEPGGSKSKGVEAFVWDATRQSQRASTVKHKTLVKERLKDAEKRKVSSACCYSCVHRGANFVAF